MYKIMKNLLEAMSENGDDGQELVDGALKAIHEFVKNNYGNDDDLDAEFVKLAAILTTGVDRAMNK